MNIKFGDVRVLHSGSVIQYLDEAIYIEVSDTSMSDSEKLTIKIEFIVDEKIKGVQQFRFSGGGKTGTLSLVNLDERPIGNEEPIRLGTILGKPLQMNFNTHVTPSNAPRIIFYTFYVNDGGDQGGIGV